MENMTDLKEVLTSNQCECDCHQQVELLLQNALKDKKEILELKLKLECMADQIKDQTIAMHSAVDHYKSVFRKLDELQAVTKEMDNLIKKETTITNLESKLQPNENNLKKKIDQLPESPRQIFGKFNEMEPGLIPWSFPGCNAFSAALEDHAAAPGWMVIQRRFKGGVKFENKHIEDYISGFGDLNGEFWLGLEKMHSITSSGKHELYIEIVFENEKKILAHYDHFVIGNKSEDYCLKSLGKYRGACCDAMRDVVGVKFSFDWWCTMKFYLEHSNLNAKWEEGMKWGPHLSSLKSVQMLMRRYE